MAGSHDIRYKKLFSNPILVKELLLSFVQEDFVRDLDFSTLQRLDKSFITDDFKEKESDLIYKINFKARPVYIYLLMEFQSSVDHFMALRILRYVMEFYGFLVQKQGIKTLPAVFPILLYNGDSRWTAATNIKDLIEPLIPGCYIPSFEYYKIIENDFPKPVLLQIKNVVSAIFYVENSDPVSLKEEIDKLVEIMRGEDMEVINLFALWINNFLTYKGRDQTEVITKKIRELTEVKPMFETAVKRYGDTLLQQGIEQGIEKGELLEKQEILIKLLHRKFSLLEKEVERIRTVLDSEKLDHALEEILFADSKEQVLGLLEE